MTVVQLKWVKKVCGIFCVEFQFVLIGIPSKMEETTKNVRTEKESFRFAK